MKFKISGNSGCDLYYENDCVIKIADSVLTSPRLRKQYDKQKSFIDETFKAPVIYDCGYKDDKFWFKMEYIRLKTFDDFFLTCDVVSLNKIVDNLIKFIKGNIHDDGKIDAGVFLHKYESVKNNIFINHSIDINYLNAYFYDADYSIPMSRGYCHGDFTFSNMLIDYDSSYLIDFLDPFIETPLQDIVKLRQDTRYFWSLGMTTGIKDVVKIKQSLIYIDRRIHEFFSDFAFYRHYYNYFQALNLLRVIPYCNDRYKVNVLLREVSELCSR
jgi:hypothetical protein